MRREQVKEYITGLGDADLVEYIHAGTAIYEPDAIAFAREELDRRRFSPAQLAELEEIADSRIAEKAMEVSRQAAQPLGLRGRILAFVLGLFGGYHAILDLFVDHGEDGRRRDHDRRKFTLLGLATVLFVIVLYGIICALRSNTTQAQ